MKKSAYFCTGSWHFIFEILLSTARFFFQFAPSFLLLVEMDFGDYTCEPVAYVVVIKPDGGEGGQYPLLEDAVIGR